MEQKDAEELFEQHLIPAGEVLAGQIELDELLSEGRV